MIKTSELNRRVEIVKFNNVIDEGGGASIVEAESYSMWAKVEDRTAAMNTEHAHTAWGYEYRITLRYDKDKKIKTDMYIRYDGRTMAITSMSINGEGNRAFAILKCTTTENSL